MQGYHTFSGTVHGIKKENLSRNMPSISSYRHGTLDMMINYRYDWMWSWMIKLATKEQAVNKYCLTDL